MIKKINKSVVAMVALLLCAFALLIFKSLRSSQSIMSMTMQVSFQGEYQIGEDDWQPIIKGKHIPADQGPVTLRGYYQMELPDGSGPIGRLPQGMAVAMYFNHIGAEIRVPGQENFPLSVEYPLAGEYFCGKQWTEYIYTGTDTDTIEILLTNPHRFGNPNAIDEFLDRMYVYSFENEYSLITEKEKGNTDRILGLVIIISALILLGVAVSSSLLGLPSTEMMWILGLLIFFAGGYFILDAPNISLWNKRVVFNTSAAVLCMMFYTLSLVCVTVNSIPEDRQKRVKGLPYLLGTVTGLLLVASFLGKIYLYDTLPIWLCFSCVTILILLVVLLRSLSDVTYTKKLLLTSVAISLLAFLVDATATVFGWWEGGKASKGVFIFLFVIAMVLVLKIIPENIRAAMREKELTAELEKKKTALMISQIRPHFIYNTLGSIEKLCEIRPKMAAKLVHEFSLYLRGNFSSLDSDAPISLSRELDHVRHYVDIEKIRFPDMTVKFDLHSADFLLPALSIQPLVENAIKHGLMGRESGGTVVISTYETDTDYVIDVSDDGVGFDQSLLHEEEDHVGIRNIRARLKTMCRGTLTIESTPDVGTKAQIKIPKEKL